MNPGIVTTTRIHITGASGAGVTTLGRAMAQHLAVPHHDTDDYFWRPTDPPYQRSRPAEDRLRLMAELFLDRPSWVLSGSLDGWGDPLIPRFTFVVFVVTATEVRVGRLRRREALRYPANALLPGGELHAESEAFIDWAASYDKFGPDQRSLGRHEAWLATLPCPVLRVDGALPTETLVAHVVAALQP
jgi:adenylate kinase family enzyme